jgi:hypothetical protein
VKKNINTWKAQAFLRRSGVVQGNHLAVEVPFTSRLSAINFYGLIIPDLGLPNL